MQHVPSIAVTALAVQNQFFLPLLDIDAPEVLKGLFKSLIRLASYVAFPGRICSALCILQLASCVA